ncbi:UNVERIFIED_CONTAM: hypothetical protein HDU68_007400 [Siphonaria sp. JEL0065]|nr:hypothetical protein HDU68_007400 [Siphonaria sp. JEL0065]
MSGSRSALPTASTPRSMQVFCIILLVGVILLLSASVRLMSEAPTNQVTSPHKHPDTIPEASITKESSALQTIEPPPPYAYKTPYTLLKTTIPPNPLLKESTTSDNKTLLQLSVSSSTCPPPKQALIGIFTTASPESTLKRSLLRQKYNTINEKLPHNFQSDHIFFFGNSDTDQEKDSTLVLEQLLFPNTTVISHRKESRDSGKILDWFKFSRSLLYTPHPSIPAEYCLRYRFVAKADEDAVIHLERLGRLLNGVETSNKAQFIGRGYNDPVMHMTGMLYLLSANTVEWIYSSLVPESWIHGVEDVMVGMWLLKGGLSVDYIEQGHQFHDLAESTAFSAGDTTNETVVLHWCKDQVRMLRCVMEVFEGNTVDLDGAFGQRFLSEDGLWEKFVGFGLAGPVVRSSEQWKSILQDIQTFIKGNQERGVGVNLAEVDGIMFRPTVFKLLEKLGVKDELAKVEVDNLVYRTSLHGYHVRGTEWKDDGLIGLVIHYLVKYRFPEGLRWSEKPRMYQICEQLHELYNNGHQFTLKEVDDLIKKVLE